MRSAEERPESISSVGSRRSLFKDISAPQSMPFFHNQCRLVTISTGDLQVIDTQGPLYLPYSELFESSVINLTNISYSRLYSNPGSVGYPHGPRTEH